MVCEKCGGTINSVGKCIICGYDREIDNTEFAVIKAKEDYKRSGRLILFITYQIFVCSIIILLGFLIPSNNAIIFGGTRIIICIFVLLYKKWAFYMLIIEYVIFDILILLTSFNITVVAMDVVINIVFLRFIVSKDWHKFK